MFVDDVRQRQRLSTSRGVRWLKAAEADGPGWVATLTPTPASQKDRGNVLDLDFV